MTARSLYGSVMRSALSILAVPVLALGLSACGDDDTKASDSSKDDAKSYSDSSIDTIADDVDKAMKGLEAVHLSGNVDDDGRTILMDVTVSKGDCEGHLEIKGQGSMDIISVDGASYFKADDAFWKSQAGEQASMITGMIGDKWATDSTDDEGFAELCDLDKLLSDMDSGDVTDDNSKVTGTEKVNGVDTVSVSFTSDDGNPGTAYVAATDPHYFVRIDVPKEGSMTFSDFDKPLDVQKPADDEVVDLGTLGS